VRTLDNHRLAKAKLKRLSVPTKRCSTMALEREHAKEWQNKLEEVRKIKG
jgi:hypothetical protein